MQFEIGDWVRLNPDYPLGSWSRQYREGVFQIISINEFGQMKLTNTETYFDFLKEWLLPVEVKTPRGNILVDSSL